MNEQQKRWGLKASAASSIGLVLSGGGSRAAYQVGALRALYEHYPKHEIPFSVLMASSIGSVNAIILGACMKRGLNEAISALEMLWRERTYANTFRGSYSMALLRSVKLAFLQYFSPGPKATAFALFDPLPVIERIDQLINDFGGVEVKGEDSPLSAVGVMTTQEGKSRNPLLLVTSRANPEDALLQGAAYDICYFHTLTASHAFASAALPAVLPAVELSLDTSQVRLVDGGICENIPVDPAIRFGADNIIIIDVSGRKWWCDHYDTSHDQQDPWESPAKAGTHCLRPASVLELRNQKAFGPLLRQSLGRSTREHIRALGPSWPILKLLKAKMGEAVAYEIVSYAVIHSGFIEALFEAGYQETLATLEQTKPQIYS